ncbi:MAG: zinc ribbon domain-containing protein [Pyrinomonadaceae bacterium]|nr:zinc ribbon domain-containing protein [Pyrinomonadaceae bacterium]
MSLIICPDCGHEVSTAADSCPNCGKPFLPPKVQIIDRRPKEEFPKWIIVPIFATAALLIFFIFLYSSQNNDNSNANISVRSGGTPARKTISETDERKPVKEITVTSPDSPTVVQPPSKEIVVPENPSTTPLPKTEPDRGIVKVSAKVLAKNGITRPVTREKFYLLDKDLSSILAEAKIDDEVGQGLKNAFALSVVDPSKYRETNEKALAAIKKHIIYSTLTDNQGKAEIKNVKPDSYYLFAISATPNSYAIWDSMITVDSGENILTIEPQSMTEVIPDPNSEDE